MMQIFFFWGGWGGLFENLLFTARLLVLGQPRADGHRTHVHIDLVVGELSEGAILVADDDLGVFPLLRVLGKDKVKPERSENENESENEN